MKTISSKSAFNDNSDISFIQVSPIDPESKAGEMRALEDIIDQVWRSDNSTSSSLSPMILFMVYSHSQILKFSLTTLAIAMTLSYGIFGVKATSGNTRSISQASLRESFGDGNFVRFRRGAIDTDARSDLDTSGRDGLAIESSVTTSGLTTGKQTRV